MQISALLLTRIGQALESGRLTEAILQRVCDEPWLGSPLVRDVRPLWSVSKAQLGSWSRDLHRVAWWQPDTNGCVMVVTNDSYSASHAGSKVSSFTFSPSGKHLAYVVEQESRRQLVVDGIVDQRIDSVLDVMLEVIFVDEECLAYRRRGNLYTVGLTTMPPSAEVQIDDEANIWVYGQQVFVWLRSMRRNTLLHARADAKNFTELLVWDEDEDQQVKFNPHNIRLNIKVDQTGTHTLVAHPAAPDWKGNRVLRLDGQAVLTLLTDQQIGPYGFLNDGTPVAVIRRSGQDVLWVDGEQIPSLPPGNQVQAVAGWGRNCPLACVVQQATSDDQVLLTVSHGGGIRYVYQAVEIREVTALDEDRLAYIAGNANGQTCHVYEHCECRSKLHGSKHRNLRNLQTSSQGTHFLAIAEQPGKKDHEHRYYIVVDGVLSGKLAQLIYEPQFVSDNEIRFIAADYDEREKDMVYRAYAVNLS